MCGAMHKKSFTLGIGFGIMVMTLVFFFAYMTAQGQTEREKMTDLAQQMRIASEAGKGMTEAEAIAYAKSQGMVYPTESESVGNAGDDAANLDSDANAEDGGENTDGTDGDENEESDDGATATGEPTATEGSDTAALPSTEPSETEDDVVWVTFTIPKGMISPVACRMLEREGLIDDAVKFEAYLTERQLDRLLAPGTFRAPMGCTYDELMTYWK